MLWNSVATGKFADKHGIHGFIEPDPINGGARPYTSISRKCKALWNILTQPDQIHPTAAGQKIIAETVWKRLQPLLQTK